MINQRSNQVNKFKPTIDKYFVASDGTQHKTREAHEQHERKILVNKVAGYSAADFDAAVLGSNLTVAADVILLASLLRQPRARRASKPGESAGDPTSTALPDGAVEQGSAPGASEAGQGATDPIVTTDGAIRTTHGTDTSRKRGKAAKEGA
jgi:hypothetical protein